MSLKGLHDMQAQGSFGFAKLWDKFEGPKDIMGTKCTALMDQLLSMFFQLVTNHITKDPLPLSPVFSQVQEVPMEIVNTVVSKDVSKTMKNKIVVEYQEILELSISTKAFKPKDVILVNDQWKCIRKPTDGRHNSIILWVKDNEFDTTPTEGKIFGVALYNAQEETKFASEHTQEHVQLEMCALMHDIQNSENCKCGMMNYGTLVKSSLGLHVTNELASSGLAQSYRLEILHSCGGFCLILPKSNWLRQLKQYQILDNESNFVYTEYKVILDLDVNTHFVWNAPHDLHGTTMNRIFTKQPKLWKTFAKSLANTDLAQWACADVFMHNAVRSASKA
ncbi:hypothetical protein PILCRDRAFT_90844 [Piloderma croceum F 1598]|uniref:Uncharacterized protein n=1 Tax=Piloderma croceum (strain F 1598) TaxID=765440 RepID=A0A0C3BLD9_PILCF|nr:hypothetical protein PILCRDRAFT_90844 [Piloderma croceum F 1598]